jgi:tRNA modification GTPase
MNAQQDTIAAISTPPGLGAISIVRISGPESFEIADRVLRCSGPAPSKRQGQTFIHGFVHSEPGDDGKGEREVDEVIMLIYRAPHSYTREDVVEIQGHGGRTAARRVLRTVLEHGARLADAGEFTMRAFLSGRVDLLQAEAVMDVIGAKSERAAGAAMEQLAGTLSNWIQRAYDILISTCAELELSLDFDDEGLPGPALDDIDRRIASAVEALESLLGTWDEGHLLREGALVGISGRPNVGKSTLLNLLIGSDRAIVAAVPGTTRDTIEEEVVIKGVPLRIVDTAGLRETDCPVESQGVDRAMEIIDRADINLHVVDASESLLDDEWERIREMNPAKAVVVFNKIDLGEKVQQKEIPEFTVVRACLLSGEGIDGIRGAIGEKLGFDGDIAAHAVISERHRRAVSLVLDDVRGAQGLLEQRREDLIVPAVTLLRGALDKLGELTGQTYTEELLTNIFSRFCIGK